MVSSIAGVKVVGRNLAPNLAALLPHRTGALEGWVQGGSSVQGGSLTEQELLEVLYCLGSYMRRTFFP